MMGSIGQPSQPCRPDGGQLFLVSDFQRHQVQLRQLQVQTTTFHTCASPLSSRGQLVEHSMSWHCIVSSGIYEQGVPERQRMVNALAVAIVQVYYRTSPFSAGNKVDTKMNYFQAILHCHVSFPRLVMAMVC